ncbi:uncharacterized protein yc1106_06379 [Curvularia clavata]|uniref:Cryptic loci regulator 2 N-terminal domain-containing protein n=1 Tax=Curvularia clavata TaxID=95742 RepID=A0A9Q9DUK9_CURCL|nr:uncharacterized protein yc1106_06379 [Curvularia clavata]
MRGRVVVRLIPGCSDGDPLHAPPPGYSQITPPTLYLEKIAQQWVTQRGEAQPGVQYILEALPAGYTMWHRPRPSDPNCFDKYLFGHPSHRKFDSPNRFFPHFQYLMDNGGNSLGCPCTVCQGSSGLLPRAAPNSSRVRSSSTALSRRSSNASAPTPLASRPDSAHCAAQERPKKLSPGLDTSSVDQDGTPDVYRNLIEKLRSHKHVDEDICEPLSPDWRAEQSKLSKLLRILKSQEQWIPRNGDIVLFVRNLSDRITIARYDTTGELRLYDEQSDEFLDVPRWEAGLVTEAAPGSNTDADLLESDTNSSADASCSGIRVEPVPDPNSTDKSLSKRYKYISLRQSRPFFLWKEMLRQVDQEQWHPSVRNALALTSTVSLMGKYRFRGTWPEATIYCQGIFVGPEMLVVGDTIRLLPKSDQTVCTDIMSIKSIRLKWTNLDKASNNDYDEGRPFNSTIWFYGAAYTSDISRSNEQWVSDQTAQPRAASDYGHFYPLHPPDKEFAIPFARTAGRLYERNALAYFLGFDVNDSITLDLSRQALTSARTFSQLNDVRIAESPDATWYWGDDRADALNLHTLNGLDVSRFDPGRDAKALRKQCRIIDTADQNRDNRRAENQDVRPALDTAHIGRLSRFLAPKLPVQPHNGKKPSANQGRDSAPAMVGRRRSRSINIDSDENEDEIRQHTRIIENHGPTSKKPKVMIVVD